MQVIYRGATFNYQFKTPSLTKASVTTNHQLIHRGHTYRYNRPIPKLQSVKVTNWRSTEVCQPVGRAPAIA